MKTTVSALVKVLILIFNAIQSYGDDEDGFNEPIDYQESIFPAQSEESSRVRLEIFLAAVATLGAKITHISAYGTAVHRALMLIESPNSPFYATSVLAQEVKILQMPHPSRLANHANIGVS